MWFGKDICSHLLVVLFVLHYVDGGVGGDCIDLVASNGGSECCFDFIPNSVSDKQLHCHFDGVFQ